ncbi:MAG TPA: VOC family protein [Candidatus Acidoferrum sp.]|nr:VOC family protein [Candidatus Acidoferrum sp.]
MKRAALLLAVLLSFSTALAQEKLKRPPITGIGRVTIYVRNHEAAMDFYSKKLSYFSSQEIPCERAPHFCFGNILQILDVVSPTSPDEGHFLGEIDFRTPNLERMHRYLESQNVKVSEIVKIERTVVHHELDYFSAVNPEGHPIGFVELAGCWICETDPGDERADWHIIHAGFVVRDRAATDHFYKDILGFRPYWHGGMKDDRDDWVAMQVPDGTDWVEYMLNIPANADKKLLGVMNHIALGVTDIQAAKAQLLKNGVKLTEEPQMGRDGKWQLNVYDPDSTRIEFMEFTPKEKPCCSEFTGPHPKP